MVISYHFFQQREYQLIHGRGKLIDHYNLIKLHTLESQQRTTK